MELAHVWTQNHFELAGQHGTMPFQHHYCRACKVVVRLPDVASHRPPSHGCTGFKAEPRIAWKSPMKEKDHEPQKKDYPASKRRKSN